jgi:hypothetical protein
MRLGLAIVLSALVHAAALGGLRGSTPEPESHPHLVPLDVTEAPPVPPPPAPAPPPAPPAPAPAKKKRVHVQVAPAGELPVAVADAGVAAEPEAPDAGPPAKVDPAVADLRPSLPPGERVMLALRADRLRGTPWAEAVEAVLAPMPDYRFLIAGTGLGIAEAFDAVVIASPAPRDVSQTFLAGFTGRSDAELRRVLGRDGRVAWLPVAGGTLGRRAQTVAGDPRVLLVPTSGWFLLVRPEHVADLLVPTPAEATPPPWLTELPKVVDLTAEPSTLAVVVVADLGVPTLRLPGLPPLPAPDRVTIAVTTDDKGWVLTGAAVLADEARARAFHDALAAGQRELLGSLPRRLLLRSFQLEGAAQRLQLALHGAQVTFSTSLTSGEVLALLEQAAVLSRQTFTP